MADVLLERRPDGVALITLNRPAQMNSMGGDVVPLMTQLLLQLADDPAVRCVVITGSGRAFSAGGDVKAMAVRQAALESPGAPPPNNDFAQRLQTLREQQYQIPYAVHTIPKPTIAAINGYAMGAGLSLALACDLRVASPAARLGTAFRNVALSGDGGGSFFLQRLVGPGKARELYFTGEIIDGETAFALGIVNKLFPDETLLEESLQFAATIAAGPTQAFARMKENFVAGESCDLRSLLDREALNQLLSRTTADYREAMAAFTEKRKPVFSGV